jgi:hypothetical protein
MNYFVYVKDILGVEINRSEFSWSYGTVAPKSSKNEFEKCKIKIFIDVRHSNEVFDKRVNFNKIGKYHYFSASKNSNRLYYERNFFGRSKLRYSIEIKNNDVYIIVGDNYFKYVKHRIMGLHAMSYILTDIVCGLLLKNEIATIHCSAVNKNGQSMIIFAPPDTGKTLTSMRLCLNHNYNFIAEDFALTDGQNLWAVPWTSTFRYYDDINNSKLDSIINKLTAIFPVLGLFRVTKNKSIDKYIGMNRVRLFSKATDIVVLERGEPNINYDKVEGLEKIINLNRYEFNYHKSPALIVMDYFNRGFSPEAMYIKEKEILGNLIERCNFMCISDLNALNYSDVISKKINDGIGKYKISE